MNVYIALAFLIGLISGFILAYFLLQRFFSSSSKNDEKNEEISESISLKDIYEKVINAEKSSLSLSNDIKSIFESFKNPIEQGVQGEDLLQLIFDTSGLIEGEQYLYNKGIEDSGRPDFIVKLPGGGALYVDAKFITRNFTEAYKTEDQEEKEELFLKSAEDVETAAKGLSSRTYTDYAGFETPEMILMFLPNDNIYANAVNRKEDLIEKCLKGFPSGNQANKTPIVLVTPSSISASLKVVSMMWRERNLYADITGVKSSLKKLHKGFKNFNKNFVEGGGSLLKASDHFRKAFNDYSSLSGEIKEVESKIDVSKIEFKEDFMEHKTQKNLSELDVKNLKKIEIDEEK